MDSLIFELQIVFYFQLFLSANVCHTFTQRLGYLIKLVTVKWSNELSEATEEKQFKCPKPVCSR